MTIHAFHDSLVKRLLDHQVVDREGRLLGKVDDLALREDGDGLVVEGLLIGPGALAPRYPGVLGRWGWAIWRRLNHPDDPGVVLVPWREITDLGSAIQVVDRAGAELLASFGLERWLRRHLIGRIPGAKGDGDQFDDDSPRSGGATTPRPRRPGRAPPTSTPTSVWTSPAATRRTGATRARPPRPCASSSSCPWSSSCPDVVALRGPGSRRGCGPRRPSPPSPPQETSSASP